MKFKSVALASVLALGTLSAHAVTSLGTVGANTTNNGGISFAPGVVNDYFTFSLTGASSLQSNVTTFVGSLTPAYYSIWSAGADQVIGGGDDVSKASFTFDGVSTSHFTSLAAGSYYINVFALAGAPAAYALSVSATTLPVPEPDTYALLGAGLGVIGFVAARRRRD